jgi:hypothetical protein
VVDWLAGGSDTCFCSWPPRQLSSNVNTTQVIMPTNTTVGIKCFIGDAFAGPLFVLVFLLEGTTRAPAAISFCPV